MAELKYDKNGRLLFTKEMKKEYTVLVPDMLPIHFNIMRNIFLNEGYKVALLDNSGERVKQLGLKYTHNDICYPALLVTGQFLDALTSGEYDPHKVALIIMQTGGGCRASNYIHIIRKALARSGFDYVPVISFNLSLTETNPGFSLTLPIIRRMLAGVIYGDMIMLLSNQTRPYEIEAGKTDQLVGLWVDNISKQFRASRGYTLREMRENFKNIIRSFAAIPRRKEKKVRVGVVGEIYVKFSPLGNNNLEQFLLSEGCEVVVPGLTDFIIFKIFNRVTDIELYGGSRIKYLACKALMNYVVRRQSAVIDIVGKSRFRAPTHFETIHYLGDGNKMGEGWLLTGEMLELIHEGIPNIVCTQPFGCLPNHIVGKGMIRPLKDDYPDSNIVAIDYDPSATAINQENRIKLMLANARQKLRQEKGKAAAAPEQKNVVGGV